MLKAHESMQTVCEISSLTAEVIDRTVEKILIYKDGRIGVKFKFLNEIVYKEEVA